MHPARTLHVSVRRHGGFGGIARTYAVDAAKLPPDRAEQLRQLVGGLPTPLPKQAAPGPPDAFQYTVTVREGDTERSTQVGEGSSLQPLIDFARDHTDG
jgi:hypothetical protein